MRLACMDLRGTSFFSKEQSCLIGGQGWDSPSTDAYNEGIALAVFITTKQQKKRLMGHKPFFLNLLAVFAQLSGGF